MNDDEVLSEALRRGRWERFTGGDGEDQLTLFLGNFKLITLHHRLLVSEEKGVLSVLGKGLKSEDTLAACVVRLAKTEMMLNEAVSLLSERGIDHNLVSDTQDVGDSVPE